MPHNRFYCDAHLEEGRTVSLDAEESRHLVRVLRAKEGDLVELVNGKGALAEASLSSVEKHTAVLTVTGVNHQTPPSPLILAQALPRMNHLEWIIEKGTELNATEFWLFPGMLSEKDSLSPTQAERLKHLAIAAMKQCGRLDLPSIQIKPPLLSWKGVEGTLLFGDTAGDPPFLWELPTAPPLEKPILFFVGPEKGFHPKERTHLLEALGAKGVRLHQNILRTETAPLAALSILQKHCN